MNRWSIPRPIRENVRKMLKAKIAEAREYYEQEKGTPQGGVLSPILANIALTILDNKGDEYGQVNPIVRYADDFVIVNREEQAARTIKDEIGNYLKENIGLNLSEKKTVITHISEGFNFLGFNIRRYKDKLLIKPQEEKSKRFLKEIGQILKENKTAKPETIIHMLNPRLQGYALYYQNVVSISKIRFRLRESLWRWATQTSHTNGS